MDDLRSGVQRPSPVYLPARGTDASSRAAYRHCHRDRRGHSGGPCVSARPALSEDLRKLIRIREVLDDLGCVRPLLGRNHEIDVSAAEVIERVVRDAGGIDAELAEPVAPR